MLFGCIHHSTSFNTSFLREVLTFDFPFWNVSHFVKKTGTLQASSSYDIISNTGTPCYSYLPLQQGREFKLLVEMGCVRLPMLVTCKA